MKISCPHCSQNLELDPETLIALERASHFDCTTCGGAVEVPEVQAILVPIKTLPQPLPPTRQTRKVIVKAVVLAALVSIAIGAYFMVLPSPPEPIQRIEGETLRLLHMSDGTTRVQDMARYRAATWSGGAQLLWMNQKANATLKLELPIATSRKVRLRAVLTRSYDYGVVEVTLDGNAVPGSPFNLNNRVVTVTNPVDWGIHDLTAGNHEIGFTVVPGPKSTHCLVGLDFVQIEPIGLKPPMDEAKVEPLLGNWNIRIGSYEGKRSLLPDGSLLVEHLDGRTEIENDFRWTIDETHVILRYGPYLWDKYELSPNENDILPGATNDGVPSTLSR